MGKVIILPKLGYTQEEGQVVNWHKKEGDRIEKGEAFFDVLTDKSVITVDAADSGTVLKIVAEINDTLPVFTPIAVIGKSGEDAEAILKSHVMDFAPDTPIKGDFGELKQENASTWEFKEETTRIKMTPKARRMIEKEQYDMDSLKEIHGTGYEGGITARDIKASPLAKKIAQDIGVDLHNVSGTGTGGRIMKKDVLQASASEREERIKILRKVSYSGVRKIIGQRLSSSKFTAPHLYFSESIDTTALTEFRAAVNSARSYAGDTKIKMSDLLILAACRALQKYPELNASLQGDEISYYESVNVGLAVAGNNGLVVPVVKNTQEKTLSQIATETGDLVERAKNGRLSPDEYSGGTFTISNLGMYGIENFTAIINPPESAILAVSSVRKKPVVCKGKQGEDEIVIRPMMNITLSVDHRIIDGMLAASFTQYLKTVLENPLLLVI